MRLALVFYLLATTTVLAETALEVTTPDDVALVKALSHDLDAVTNSMTTCAGTGKALAACYCAAAPEIADLQSRQETVLKTRALWQDRMIHVAPAFNNGLDLYIDMQSLRENLDQARCTR